MKLPRMSGNRSVESFSHRSTGGRKPCCRTISGDALIDLKSFLQLEPPRGRLSIGSQLISSGQGEELLCRLLFPNYTLNRPGSETNLSSNLSSSLMVPRGD